jgi:hypothetical protein
VSGGGLSLLRTRPLAWADKDTDMDGLAERVAHASLDLE